MLGPSKTLSFIVLIAANLVPLLGVYVFGWTVVSILVVYWLESLIIGLLNIPCILAADNPVSGKIFISGFFAVHYGFFVFVHAIFLDGLFDARPVFLELLNFGALFWTALGLGLSHVISIGMRFSRGEFSGKSPNEQMKEPYNRVVVMQVVVLLGGIGFKLFNEPMAALFLLIAVKLILDVGGYIRERRQVGGVINDTI